MPQIDFASNDYLSLTKDHRLVAAGCEAMLHWGTGSASSRVVRGTFSIHVQLETALATFLARESALVLSTGYHANLSALTTLGSPNAPLIMDAHSHASLVDGARLSRRKVWYCDHNDPDHVLELLKANGSAGCVVVTESIFSVLGDAAQIPVLADICQAYQAILVVDEAHAIGVIGRNPSGVLGAGAAARCLGEHVVVTGTLSKSLASQGGFIAGSTSVINKVREQARPFIYDTGLAPAAAGAAHEAIKIITEDESLVSVLAERVQEAAARLGLGHVPGAVFSQPELRLGAAKDVARKLAQRRIDVGVFRPQSTPDRRGRVRVTFHAGISEPDYEYALKTLGQYLQELD